MERTTFHTTKLTEPSAIEVKRMQPTNKNKRISP